MYININFNPSAFKHGKTDWNLGDNHAICNKR